MSNDYLMSSYVTEEVRGGSGEKEPIGLKAKAAMAPYIKIARGYVLQRIQDTQLGVASSPRTRLVGQLLSYVSGVRDVKP